MEAIIKAERVKVFIPDEELVWVTADIIEEVKPGHYDIEIDDVDYVKTQSKRKVITMKSLPRNMDSLPLQNDGLPDTGVSDMCTLNYLHEASILDNLRRRFKSFTPYTYTGEICIAVNPYQWLDVYTTELREKHLKFLRHEQKPHVYATSAASFRGLRDYNRNQSILVSGESGAGKTETVKILMGHLAHISGRKNDSTIDKVLKANPLLESFGNAKTARNDNSSRFGKFTQLQFDQFSVLGGSRCVTYLLEKSRVITQNSLERNYHIFHQVFAAPESVKEKLFLGGLECEDFRYTSAGDIETNTIEGVSDGDRFEQTMQVLELLGVTAEQRDNLKRIIAGIVYLGQIKYDGDADLSFTDPTTRELEEKCCTLLGIEPSAFDELTTVRRIDAAGQEMLVKLSRDQASDGRDALAKDMYDRLFAWLVSVINESTAAHELEKAKGYGSGEERVIALLDIFGFESFKVNRFEQLCINFANEKLQQKFTQDVFMAVQQEYKEEGLEWELIGYKDNAEVLELLEGRLGVISLLNEECLMPRGTDLQYLAKLGNACNKHPCFTSGTLTLQRDEFCVNHYAGKVAYSVTGFVERNRDALPSEMRQLMLSSKNSLCNQIFQNPEGGAPADSNPLTRPSASAGARGGARAKRNLQSFMKADTVTTKFRSQLNSLMETISRTDVQYVRCIKPNALKSRHVFDRQMIVEQLRCAGMIEAIRISRAAYPYRITHNEFALRFGGLRSGAWMRKQMAITDEQKCRALLKDILTPALYKKLSVGAPGSGMPDKAYEMGRTKVYFSSGVLEMMEEMRGNLIWKYIKDIQRMMRGCVQRKRYRAILKANRKLQNYLRMAVRRLVYLRYRSAILSLQRGVRVHRAKRIVTALRRQINCVQIQSWIRSRRLRIAFVRLRTAAVVVGAWAKMIVQRDKFKKLIVEVKENAKLSNQLESLKKRLQEEAVARENYEQAAAEKLAAEKKAATDRLAAELEEMKKKAMVDAEKHTEKIREEARQALEAERAKLIEEQEKLRAEMETQSLQRQASAGAEMKEELLAIEGLQTELSKVKAKNDQLAEENRKLKSQLRRESNFVDLRTGELAVGRVQLETLEKERDSLRQERDKYMRMTKQLKLEKTHILDTLVTMSNEVDETQLLREQLGRRFVAESKLRILQLKNTVDILNARGVDRRIVQEIQTMVSTSAEEMYGNSTNTDDFAQLILNQFGRQQHRRRPSRVGPDSRDGGERGDRGDRSDRPRRKKGTRRGGAAPEKGGVGNDSERDDSVISSVSTHRQQQQHQYIAASPLPPLPPARGVLKQRASYAGDAGISPAQPQEPEQQKPKQTGFGWPFF